MIDVGLLHGSLALAQTILTHLKRTEILHRCLQVLFFIGVFFFWPRPSRITYINNNHAQLTAKLAANWKEKKIQKKMCVRKRWKLQSFNLNVLWRGKFHNPLHPQWRYQIYYAETERSHLCSSQQSGGGITAAMQSVRVTKEPSDLVKVLCVSAGFSPGSRASLPLTETCVPGQLGTLNDP